MTGNHWEVVSAIGAGGMGSVYLVKDEDGRQYALKTFNNSLFHRPSAWRLLEQEAVIWVLLDHHPNIVPALWCERIEDMLCILLEYVPGGNVEQLLESGPLAPSVALGYGLAICDAMVYAHDKLRLVHRDIKPANCLVDSRGHLKLTDFGIAWLPDPKHPNEEQAPSGTAGYKAPEQCDFGTRVDTRADLYAFAATFFQMITGVNVQRLAATSSSLLLFQHVSSNRRLRRISPDLRDLIVRCLQPQPAERPSGFPEVRAELSAIHRRITKLPAASPPGITPLRVDELQNKGVALQILGWYEPALDCYERALRILPQDYELWLGKSAVLHLLGRNEAAMSASDQGLELEPECGDLWNNRGMALLDTSQLEEALGSFSRALDCDSTDPVFWRNKGFALYRLGRLPEAVEAYDRGLSHQRRDSRLYQYKAQALVGLGRLEEAIGCLKEGLDVSPLHPGLYHGLGVAYHRLGLLTQAVAALNHALEILPNDVGILRSKALVLLAVGEWMQGLQVVDHALNAVPDDYQLLKTRATLLWRLERTEEGIRVFGDLWRTIQGDERLQAELRDHTAGLGIPENWLLEGVVGHGSGT